MSIEDTGCTADLHNSAIFINETQVPSFPFSSKRVSNPHLGNEKCGHMVMQFFLKKIILCVRMFNQHVGLCTMYVTSASGVPLVP